MGLFGEAKLAREKKEHEQALRTSQQKLSAGSATEQDYVNVGRFLKREKRYNDLVTLSQEAIGKFPKNWSFHYFIGHALLDQNSDHEAFISFESALEFMQPHKTKYVGYLEEAEILVLMSICKQTAGEISLALELRKKALEADARMNHALNLRHTFG